MSARMGPRRYLHWPRTLRLGHAVAIALVPVLLASGIALYWPPVHTVLIPYLIIIYDGHVALGLVWLGLLIWPVVLPPRFAGRRTLSTADWMPLLATGMATAATGLVLVTPGVFPATVRFIEAQGHGVLAAVLAILVAAHALARWRRVALRNWRFAPGRLAFLRYAALGVVGALGVPLLTRVPGAVARSYARATKGASPNVQAVLNEFITYSVAGYIPSISPDRYRLAIDGGVETPLVLSFADLMGLPAVELTRSFQCVTGWGVPDVRWTGVRLSTLLGRAHPRSGYDVVRFYSADDVYTDTLSGAQLAFDDVLLAYKLDGEALPDYRGGPVRLVVPEMFGYKSVKWVTRLELTRTVVPGYWEDRGYAVNAWLSS